MKARVTTMIDGDKLHITGNLSTDHKKLTAKNGMFINIEEGDTIELIAPRKRDKLNIAPCPFDMHKWFKASKQL